MCISVKMNIAYNVLVRYCSWVNQPPCDSCGQKTVSLGMDAALPPELLHGGSLVEIYRYATAIVQTHLSPLLNLHL